MKTAFFALLASIFLMSCATQSNVKKIDSKKEKAIVSAVEAQDLVKLKLLIDSVEDVKTLVHKDTLLLHISEKAHKGGLVSPVTEYLISKKAYILQFDKDGKTFGRYYIRDEVEGSPRSELVHSILDEKVKLYYGSFNEDSVEKLKSLKPYTVFNDKTLLDAGYRNAVKIINYLISEGVDVKNNNVLNKVIAGPRRNKSFTEREKTLRFLIEKSADINHVDKKGNRPLMTLVKENIVQEKSDEKISNKEKLAIYFVKKGASTENILFEAAIRKYENLVKVLLDKGVEIDKKSLSNIGISETIVRMFIEKGADPINFTNHLTAISDKDKQLEFMKYLIGKGVKPKEIPPSTLLKHFDNLKYLIENGGAFKIAKGVPLDDYILIRYVTQNGTVDQIKYLVEKGIDFKEIHLMSRNGRGFSILHYLINDRKSDSKLELVKYFTEKGVDLNIKNKVRGETVLDLALRKKLTEIAAYLKEQGAKTSAEL